VSNCFDQPATAFDLRSVRLDMSPCFFPVFPLVIVDELFSSVAFEVPAVVVRQTSIFVFAA